MAEGRDSDLPLKNARSWSPRSSVVVIYRVCLPSPPSSFPLSLALHCLSIKERGRACVKLRQVMAKSLGAAGRSATGQT